MKNTKSGKIISNIMKSKWNYEKEIITILKLKYPDIYNEIDKEWRINKTNEVISNNYFYRLI